MIKHFMVFNYLDEGNDPDCIYFEGEMDKIVTDTQEVASRNFPECLKDASVKSLFQKFPVYKFAFCDKDVTVEDGKEIKSKATNISVTYVMGKSVSAIATAEELSRTSFVMGKSVSAIATAEELSHTSFSKGGMVVGGIRSENGELTAILEHNKDRIRMIKQTDVYSKETGIEFLGDEQE